MSYFFINKAFDQYPCRRSKSKYIDCLNFVLFCFNPTSLLHIVFCISNVLFMSVNIHSLYLSPALSLHPSISHTPTHHMVGALTSWGSYCVMAVVAIYICARVCVCVYVWENVYVYVCIYLALFCLFWR